MTATLFVDCRDGFDLLLGLASRTDKELAGPDFVGVSDRNIGPFAMWPGAREESGVPIGEHSKNVL